MKDMLWQLLWHINPTLAFLKLHWLRVLLVTAMLLLLWRQHGKLQAARTALRKPVWLVRLLSVPGARFVGAIGTTGFAVSLIYLLLIHPPYSYKDPGMPAEITLSPRLQRLFERTKIICFGRYAMTVPHETEVLWGAAGFPSNISILSGGMTAMNSHIAEDITQIRMKDESAEIVTSSKGPVQDSWQLAWFTSNSAKKFGRLSIKTYITKDDLSFNFAFKASTGAGQSPRDIEKKIAQHKAIAQSLHLRPPHEVPTIPGFCINQAFIADDRYADQETIAAGLYFPSLPDLSFSVYSNKNASTEGSNGEGLLERTAEAKRDQGLAYPQVTELRLGKHVVNHWQGEEALVLRPDGVHEFRWESVGVSGDVANPPWFTIDLYSKVADNRVGAASKTTLSDDETVALWDKLLAGLKLRVKTPGAPEGSFYYRQPSIINP